MESVLVTGGAGYVGSHACKALARSGYQPIVFDNLCRGHREAVRWGPLEVGDIADTDALIRCMTAFRVTAVLHFAAFAYVGESMENPGLYFRNNVAGSLSVLTAMQAAGVRDIVFSSTCAVYGQSDGAPISESMPLAPITPYGESKLMVERELRWFGACHGLRYVALRYFNAAGADLDSEIGERHQPETHLIPLAIQAALGQGPPLKIFGTDFDTPRGTAIRDFVHVADLADAHVRALEHLRRDGESQALNLGTGYGHEVADIVDTVGEIAGRPVPVILTEKRAGDAAALVANPALAASILGWTPRSSDLPAIISSALRWHEKKSP